MNLPRVLAQRAWAVKTGIELAFPSGPIPFDYADAISRTETEAADLLYRANADRYISGKLAGDGWD